MNIRFDPGASASVAMSKIEARVNKVVPDAVFSFDFVDEAYSRKFGQEQRVGELSAIFAGLAMIICLCYPATKQHVLRYDLCGP